MICTSRELDRACQSSGNMYYNIVANSVFPMLALQSDASFGQAISIPPPPLPANHGMVQDFQQYGLINNRASLEDASNYMMKQQQQQQQLRGLWCYGIQSDVAKEWLFLLNRNGMTAAGSKLAAEADVEGGTVVVRSQLCPWSNSNVGNTNEIAATDIIIFQQILDVALSADTRRPGSIPEQGWCKYCCSLEKELTNSLKAERRANETSWEKISFNQVDPYFESRTSTSVAEQAESRKRKRALDGWENDRSAVLLKLNEFSMRASQAEQRVLELEQLLRDQALLTLDETCDDSDIVTSTSQYDCFNEEQSEMLVCKMARCNKAFKSSKTLRRHVLQKHSKNARFLICNQATVDGVVCRFETIHSGVLSYHRKHSLAHQRREDWHISCPLCHCKFARQHEMERHRRICKSRTYLGVSTNNSFESIQSSVTTATTLQSDGVKTPPSLKGISPQSDGVTAYEVLPTTPNSSFVMPDQRNNSHNHLQIFSMPDNIIESNVIY